MPLPRSHWLRLTLCFPSLVGISCQVSLRQLSLDVVQASGWLRKEVPAVHGHLGWFGQGDCGLDRPVYSFSYTRLLKLQACVPLPNARDEAQDFTCARHSPH